MVDKPKFLLEQVSYKEKVVSFICFFKISSYNYIASTFEPIIEKSSINIEFLHDNNDEDLKRNALNINILNLDNTPMNINISDYNVIQSYYFITYLIF